MKDTLQKLRKAIVRGQGQQGMTKLSVRPKNVGGRLVDVRSSTMTFKNYRWILILTLIAAVYYAFIASDRYVTSAQIYVKSTKNSSMALPNLGLIAGVGGQAQDALLLQSFIQSNDMLQRLQAKIGLKEHFSDKQWDFVSRMETDPAVEDFLDYFRSRIKVQIELESSIIVIEGQAYTPEFSQKMVAAILEEAETYLNEVGQKIAKQEISFIEGQLARNQARMETARRRLLDFQNEYGLLSPEAKGQALQGVLNTLEAELVQLETEKKTLETYLNENAPQLVAVSSRIESVRAQIEEEQLKIAAQGADSINEIGDRYHTIRQEVTFATQLYKTSLASLEQAKVESYHKLKHLVVVQTPSLPDEALEPRKFYNLATLFVILSLAYGIITMILATIREHRDV